MLLILFGLSGSGKNFVGEILAKEFNYHFFDADTILPEAMRECIRNKQSFTQAMRDDFTQLIIQETKTLQKKYSNLVIAQAFYKEANRQQLLTAFPDVKLIHIQAQTTVIAERLMKNDKTAVLDYAHKITLNFEPPRLTHLIIENNSNREAVIEQLQQLKKNSKI